MTNTIYCTYLTIYKGNKLPPFYIGSTSIENINKGYHGSVSSNRYKDIWKSELKTNPNLFKTIVISTHQTREEALAKEMFLQQKMNVAKSPMYINMAIANKKFISYEPRVVSEEARKKMSIAKKGKPQSPEHIEKCRQCRINAPEEVKKKFSQSNKGKKFSEEHKKKISESNKGRKLTEEQKQKWYEKNGPHIGRKHSEESKQKMRDAHKNISDETRKKISDSGKGRIFSEEHKRKISESKKEYYRKKREEKERGKD